MHYGVPDINVGILEDVWVNHLEHRLSAKVITALAVVAVGVWVAAPGAVVAALPMLVLALCPLSMLVMVLLMRGSRLRMQVAELEARWAGASDEPADPAPAVWHAGR